MNKKLLALKQKRERLIFEAENQRVELTELVEVWRPTLSLTDQVIRVVKLAKEHPAITLGAGAVLLKVLRPRHISKWLGRGWLMWQVFRKLKH
ncbi:MAG: YqjK-like family protein [Methylophilus sp.]